MYKEQQKKTVIQCYIVYITVESYMKIIISNSSSVPIYEQFAFNIVFDITTNWKVGKL